MLRFVRKKAAASLVRISKESATFCYQKRKETATFSCIQMKTLLQQRKCLSEAISSLLQPLQQPYFLPAWRLLLRSSKEVSHSQQDGIVDDLQAGATRTMSLEKDIVVESKCARRRVEFLIKHVWNFRG